MVLMYLTNQLSAAERRLVEEDFRTNLQVQSWFVELDALPDTVVGEEKQEQAEFSSYLSVFTPRSQPDGQFACLCESGVLLARTRQRRTVSWTLPATDLLAGRASDGRLAGRASDGCCARSVAASG